LASASLTAAFESIIMKKLLPSIFFPLLLLGHPVNAAEALVLSDLTGLVQQWRSDSASIMVEGKVYETADNVVFMDGQLKSLSRNSLKSGAKVMLMVANGKVTHVIVNPAQTSPFDRPDR
jgi:hypothetical protein